MLYHYNKGVYMQIIPSELIQMWDNEPKGKHVQTSSKTYKDAKRFFKEVDENMSDDTIMYNVYSISALPQQGKLNWGMTILNPIYVHDECNMTRGHFHEDLNCEEYYWCVSGEGLLMLMNEEGKCWCEEMKVGSLHHIASTHAHRLINTGEEELKVVACWPAHAGHDYKRIEEHPFKYRIYKKSGKIQIKESEHE